MSRYASTKPRYFDNAFCAADRRVVERVDDLVVNARGIATARGGKWDATTVRNILKRVA